MKKRYGNERAGEAVIADSLTPISGARGAARHCREGLKLPSRATLLNLTTILWFCGTPLRAVLSRLLYLVGLSDHVQLVAGIVIYLPLFLYSVLYRELPRCRTFVTVFLVVVATFAVTYLVHPEYEYWFIRDNYGVAYTIFSPDRGALWALLMVEISMSTGNLWRTLKAVALIQFLYGLFSVYQAMQNGGSWSYIDYQGETSSRDYSLEFGYNMIFVALVCLAMFLKEKKKLPLIPFVVCVLLVLEYGPRGSFLCLFVFVILCILFGIRSVRIWVFLLPVLIAAIAVVVLFGNDMLLSFGNYLKYDLGLDSRTIDAIVFDDLYADSGRDNIYDLAISAIRSNPFGYGAYGDRPIIGPYYNWGYCHNIYYEMAINFGVLPAAVILALIVAMSVFRLTKAKDPASFSEIAVVLSMCACLIVSDTFWGYEYFWMLVGILIIPILESKRPIER